MASLPTGRSSYYNPAEGRWKVNDRSVNYYMDSTVGSGVKNSKWMAIPQKVHSRSRYAFRQPRGYHKNLSHTKSCHHDTHRPPGAQLYRNHRHHLFCLLRPRKWASSKHGRGMVHRSEQFYERGEKSVGYVTTFQTQVTEARSLPSRDFRPIGRADNS